MSSDIQDTLEEINRKLQVIIENSFLSKLDLMFSVSISLTIFAISLTLNNISSVVGLLRAFLISFLILMIYTLIGEFWAILKNDVVKRFAFWMSLLFAMGIMGFTLPFFAILISPPFSVLFLIFPFVFMVFIPWLGWHVDNAFTSYAKRLSSRKLPMTTPSSIWFTIGGGYTFFTFSLIASVLLFGF